MTFWNVTDPVAGTFTIRSSVSRLGSALFDPNQHPGAVVMAGAMSQVGARSLQRLPERTIGAMSISRSVSLDMFASLAVMLGLHSHAVAQQRSGSIGRGGLPGGEALARTREVKRAPLMFSGHVTVAWLGHRKQ